MAEDEEETPPEGCIWATEPTMRSKLMNFAQLIDCVCEVPVQMKNWNLLLARDWGSRRFAIKTATLAELETIDFQNVRDLKRGHMFDF